MSELDLRAAQTAIVEAPRPRASARTRAASTAVGVWPSVLGIFGFLALWEFGVWITSTPVFIVPAPSAVFVRLWQDLPMLLNELMYTLVAAYIGLAIGGFVGITGAVIMSQWRLLERSLFPLAVMLKLVPFVAIAPLLVVWIGYDLKPKILLAALITFFPILVNCITGLRAADPLAVEFFQSVGANRWETLTRLRWQTSLPYLFAALKVCVNLAKIGAIVGEFFGATNGIGKVISVTALRLDMRGMFAAIVLLAVIGVALTILTNVVERRMLFWHESVRR
jgi:NitT/TauT family transport system permease protein